MAKKDILFMCQFFYPEYITSAQLPYQTAVFLANAGYKVDVLSGYPSEYMAEKDVEVPLKEIKDGINIYRVKYLQLSRTNKMFRIINYFSIVFFMSLRTFKLRRYESIVVYSNPPILPLVAIVANALFGTKIIFISYDVYPEIAINTETIAEKGIISSVMTRINSQLFKRATKIVALSTEMKEYLVRNRDVSSNKIDIIPNWDTDQNVRVAKSKVKENSEWFTLSYLGNMGIPQDFTMLLNAMKDSRIRESNIKLVFAGHGSKKDEIEEFVSLNNLDNVTINGYLQGKEYEDLKTTTDSYILSLKKELNGQAVPSKFYTYLSSNKPVLAIIDDTSDIAREIKGFDLGYQVNHGDTEKLVESLLRLSKENSPYNNKEIYEKHYSKDIQLRKYLDMFESILE